ncbi:unnamed protein product [Urochloa humidicola]
MAHKLLPTLHLNDHYATICVRVTRKWEYRGPADDGDVQHVDLVIADEEIATVANAPSAYPRYTYRLTAFEDLPMLVGNTRDFVDVLGIVTQISEIEMIQPSSNHEPVATRKLVLADASGLETQVTLWGQRATQFTVVEVYNEGDAKPVVILVVGCLMKSYRDIVKIISVAAQHASGILIQIFQRLQISMTGMEISALRSGMLHLLLCLHNHFNNHLLPSRN